MGGVLRCRRFHSSFRTTLRPPKPWIVYSNSAQTMQSLVRFMLEKHAQMVDPNHPSFRSSPNMILGNVQLSFSPRKTWVTSDTTDPIILRPFIAVINLRVFSNDHLTSNAHPRKLENLHRNIPALIAYCSPWYDDQALFSFFQPGTVALPSRKKGGIVGASGPGPGPLVRRPSTIKGYN